jgi:hypothetical protein
VYRGELGVPIWPYHYHHGIEEWLYVHVAAFARAIAIAQTSRAKATRARQDLAGNPRTT